MCSCASQRWAVFALFVVLEVASAHSFSSAVTSFNAEDPLNCSLRITNEACSSRDGCSWCLSSAGEVKPSCVPWNLCTGPVGRCELRTQTTCEKSLGRIGLNAPNNTSCAWCTMESRCVQHPKQISAALSETQPDLGQCIGCDGRFDSGTVIDACGVCGGACVAPFVTLDNALCWCLGCDGVPFSHTEVDICGVCGGHNTTCAQFPFTAEQGIGIALSISGNFLISVSLNLQKYVHNQNEEASGGQQSYVEIPLWWVGMLLMVLGETGNFLAYAYASATLVAPLGAVTVISNCILAHYVLKEELRPRNIFGVVLAIIGAVFIVTYAPGSDKQLTMELLEQYMSQGSFILFVLCIVFTVVGLSLLSEHYKKKYVVVYLLICSLLGCLTVMCVKGVSTALVLTIRGHNAFNKLLPVVLLATLLGTGIVQIRILNLAMINFGASEVVPVYYVLFTFCSIVGGMVLYKEYHQHCPDDHPNCHHTLYFLIGCVVTFSGVFLITFADKESDRDYRRDHDVEQQRASRGWGSQQQAPERESLLAAADSDDRDRVDPRQELRPVAPGASERGRPGYLPSEL